MKKSVAAGRIPFRSGLCRISRLLQELYSWFNFLTWLIWSKLWNFFRKVAPLILLVGIQEPEVRIQNG
ncbi:MAG: hypothetical protein P8129_20675 [Anaerolineae bacterium]